MQAATSSFHRRWIPRASVWTALALVALIVPSADAALLKGIQSGEVSVLTETVAVPITPVDASRSFLVFGTRTNTDDPNETQTSGNFTAGQNDELTFARNDGLGTANVYWYLAEFASGVSVQRGSVTLTGTTTTVNIGAVDLTKSFPLISYRTPGPDWDGNDFVQASLPSATQLQLDLGEVPNASAIVEWQVVEFADAIVHPHNVTMASNQSLLAVTPGYPIDPSKMWLIYSYATPDGADKISRHMVRGFFDGGGGFSFDRYNTGVSVSISAFVVEFTDVTEVRQGTASWGIGPPLNLPVTVSPSVSLASSIAVGGYHNKGGKANLDESDSGISTAWAQFKLTGSTSMIVHRGRADEAAQIEWSVIEFSPPAPTWSLSGKVFQDTVGDGLADGPIGGTANPASGSVTVYLYDDTGGTPNQPDATDGAGGSTTTAGDGSFSFAGLTDGTYWIVVDSKTLAVDTNLWAEQTYGPLGGWCADGAGGTTQGIGAAGACYGGRRVDPLTANPSSDNLTTWYSGAEHLARVTISGGNLTNVNFGFSYNAVATTRGGDTTDDDGSNPRSVQGSLRQFVQNANAIGGANTMRFVPAEPTSVTVGGDSWWQINVTTTFDTITDALTVIDGSAYDFADGTTLLDGSGADPTPGMIGTGGNVGVTPATLSQISKPELELRGSVASNGFILQGNNSTVRRIAARRFAASIQASGTATGLLIERNVLGTAPNGLADPGAGERNAASGIGVGTSASGTIQQNLIGWTGQAGASFSGDGTWTFIDNEVESAGQAFAFADGVAINGAVNVTLTGNRIRNSAGFGISTLGTGTRLFEDNSIIACGAGGSELANVYIKADNATVRKNVIDAAPGPGISVPPGITGVELTQNHFTNNGGTSIDLIRSGGTITDEREGDGIQLNGGVGACGTNAGAGNDGIDYPVIESALLFGSNTRIQGTACPGGTIEIYKANAGAGDLDTNSDPHGEGEVWVGGGPVDGAGDFDVTLTGLALSDTISAIVIDGSDNTSEFGVNATVASGLKIVKRAFQSDGTPIASGATLPRGTPVTFLLYINNPGPAVSDVSLRDVLNPLFLYVTESIWYDNSIASCLAATCTAGEEAAIFAAAVSGTDGSDDVDGDAVSFAGATLDVGNQSVANAPLNLLAGKVWAAVFTVRMQ